MKRTLQVSVVKKPKDDVAESSDEDDLETLLVYSAAVANIVRQIGYAALAYVAADTVRQVIVASATRE